MAMLNWDNMTYMGPVSSPVPYAMCMNRKTVCDYNNGNASLIKIQIQNISRKFYYHLGKYGKRYIYIWPVFLLPIPEEFAEQFSVYMSINMNVMIIWWCTEVDEQSPLWQ